MSSNITNGLSWEYLFMASILPSVISMVTTLCKSIIDQVGYLCFLIYKYFTQPKFNQIVMQMKYQPYANTTFSYSVAMDRDIMAMVWYIQKNNIKDLKSFKKLPCEFLLDSTGSKYPFGTLAATLENEELKKYSLNLFTLFEPSDKKKTRLGLKLADDLYILSYEDYDGFEKNESKETKTLLSVNYSIRSRYKSVEEIVQFIQKNTIAFNAIYSPSYSRKIYHYIYQGMDTSSHGKQTLRFEKYLFSNLDVPDQKNNITFDHLFYDEKESIIADVERLSNLTWFRDRGMKRRLGFFFEGASGSGKTATAIAIANLTERHIIEVPMSRVTTNKEIEKLVNIQDLDGLPISKDKILLLFDEMDQAKISLSDEKLPLSNAHEKDKRHGDKEVKDEKDESKHEKAPKDELNFHFLLSAIDGICNTEGLIIIATTNNKEKFSKSLIRDGRLNCIHFDNISDTNMIKMIEFYYKRKISNKLQLKILKKISGKIPTTTFRNLVMKHMDTSSLDGLLIEPLLNNFCISS